jgi:aspartyl-tRNA(Asn)/glutamyl-tRNA(Gln) amidotransferase subunit C
MKIEKDRIKYTSNLARISLTASEEELFAGQLNDILTYMEKINEIDTSGIEPTSHVIAMDNVFRCDVQKKPLSQTQALVNAPDKKGSFFRVPRVIE